MTDDCGDLDPYLVDLFGPSDPVGDDPGMSADGPITMEQLAQEAGKYFRTAALADVPAKLWVDCYAACDPPQFYLRASFDHRVSNSSLVRLAALTASLEEHHRLALVLVAYGEDRPWEEIEQANRDLNAVL